VQTSSYPHPPLRKYRKEHPAGLPPLPLALLSSFMIFSPPHPVRSHLLLPVPTRPPLVSPPPTTPLHFLTLHHCLPHVLPTPPHSSPPFSPPPFPFPFFPHNHSTLLRPASPSSAFLTFPSFRDNSPLPSSLSPTLSPSSPFQVSHLLPILPPLFLAPTPSYPPLSPPPSISYFFPSPPPPPLVLALPPPLLPPTTTVFPIALSPPFPLSAFPPLSSLTSPQPSFSSSPPPSPLPPLLLPPFSTALFSLSPPSFFSSHLFFLSLLHSFSSSSSPCSPPHPRVSTVSMLNKFYCQIPYIIVERASEVPLRIFPCSPSAAPPKPQRHPVY